MTKPVSEIDRDLRKVKSVSDIGWRRRNGNSASRKRQTKSLSELDGDERVIATAEHIVFSVDRLDTTHDMLNILSDFDSRFSHKTGRLEAYLEERFRSAEELVHEWAPPTTNTRRYLRAVDEIHSLMTNADTRNDILERAQSVNRMARVRLLEEFQHALHKHSRLPDTECLYNRLSGPDDRDSVPDRKDSASGVITWEDYKNVGLLIDLVRPEDVPDIRDIAQRLIVGQHEQDFCRVYAEVRREFLDETLRRLGLEKLSVEEIQKTTWASLEGKIKKWIQAIKIAVRVLFPSEKRLCSWIFQGIGSVEEDCFSETCKGPMMKLMIFSEAMAISCRSSERLFRILDMYETLSDLMVDVHSVFSDEGIRAEASEIVARLGKAAQGTFDDFANAVERDGSKTPIAGGAIHPLTRYVMNYSTLLFDYTDSLLKVVRVDAPNNPNNSDDESSNSSSLSLHLLKIIETLKCKLDEKSGLYQDRSLTHLFLMNNIHYIVQKVKDSSKLRAHLGDDWVKKHHGQVRQLAMNYQRAAWNKVLDCLKDAGLYSKGNVSGAVSKELKKRFKRFNAAFEEVYRTQTTWTVPDCELREELRISITEKLLPAYRSFQGRYRNHWDTERHAEKYIKYTSEDLEKYVVELFEGSSGSMDHRQRSNSLPSHSPESLFALIWS